MSAQPTTAGGAFRDRQFRLFFLGVFFAVQAIWVQRVTLGWVAWELTGSAAFVGLVAALSLLPVLVAGPVFGVYADRLDIRKAALVTNAAMALVLAVLALALPVMGAGGLIAGAAAIGVISAAHHPVRMSLGPRLVPPKMVPHVVTATALNFNIARLVAPVVAGWVIATSGAGTALWVSVVCYIPMAAVLPYLSPRALPPRVSAPFLHELAEGFRYAVTSPVVRSALLLTVIFAAVVRGSLELLPVVADGAFARGATGLGILTAAAGIGAIVSASLKAFGAGSVQDGIPTSALLAAMGGQAAVIALGLAPVWPLALVAAAMTGFCSTFVGVSMQTSIQVDLPDAYRGRVMSLWVMVGFGTVAVGSFAIGVLGEWIGIAPALVAAGVAGAIVQLAIILGVRRRP